MKKQSRRKKPSHLQVSKKKPKTNEVKSLKEDKWERIKRRRIEFIERRERRKEMRRLQVSDD